MYLKVAGQAKMEEIRSRRRKRRDLKVMETLNANKIHHQAQSKKIFRNRFNILNQKLFTSLDVQVHLKSQITVNE